MLARTGRLTLRVRMTLVLVRVMSVPVSERAAAIVPAGDSLAARSVVSRFPVFALPTALDVAVRRRATVARAATTAPTTTATTATPTGLAGTLAALTLAVTTLLAFSAARNRLR